MREEDQPDAGGVQGKATAHAKEDPAGLVRGEAFDEDCLSLVPDGEEYVLAGGVVKILHERECDGAQAMATWGERGNFEKA